MKVPALSTTILALLCVAQPSLQGSCGVPARASQPSSPTFQDRVRALEAIERVRYSHQVGASLAFEEAFPRGALERRVRNTLKQTVALEDLWKTRITAVMLEREAARMAERTRMPERLAELYAALGNDPVLILECLTRPALVDRLTRSFFAFDRRIHSRAREEAETLRERLVNREIDPLAEDSRRTELDVRRQGDGGSTRESPDEQANPEGQADQAEPAGHAERPDRMEQVDRQRLEPEVGAVEETRDGFVVRVTLSGLVDGSGPPGSAPSESTPPGRFRVASYQIAKRTWDEWWAAVEPDIDETCLSAVMPDAGWAIPPVRSDPDSRAPSHPGVQARSRLMRAEGEDASPIPTSDFWDNGSLDDVPDGRSAHTAIWTGSEMIVWGGHCGGMQGTGVRYDPATDTWAPISMLNAPPPRAWHTAVWTGSRMIVWGGCCFDDESEFSGGLYDPATDSWQPTSTVNAPRNRELATAVWTGREMIVWGGDATGERKGGRYDPATDAWKGISPVNEPSARYGHTAVWTGSRMIVWGGLGTRRYRVLGNGARYNPVSNTWIPISSRGAPGPRYNHTAVWTGSRMVVCNGLDDDERTRTLPCGSYDPRANTWKPISTQGSPSSLTVTKPSALSAQTNGGASIRRQRPHERTAAAVSSIERAALTAVWTGREMIVWGGGGGARYDPALDRWTQTSTVNAPSPRWEHTAVWTGSQMIVWGAARDSTGGRYDPETDTWTPTSVGNGPTPRYGHTSVWTGSEMIVWGGNEATPLAWGTGGRYDPVIDAWTAISTTDAPARRSGHSVVWTGQQMIVWGGYVHAYPGTRTRTGARYDPATDTWTATSIGNAPSERSEHTAVWTGSRMIIWGGIDLGDGGRYDPSNNSWLPIPIVGAPSGRTDHTAVWTGTEMIVWGGTRDLVLLNTGGRYDPVRNFWRTMSLENGPTPRTHHSAVWTGSEMIVWGGRKEGINYEWLPDTGGRYDPARDMWTATSTDNAPNNRWRHTAVWTGSRMIAWGGVFGSYNVKQTGGLYDPASDTWAPTTLVHAPGRRCDHTAIWTGSRMIVWGGDPDNPPDLGSGGIYSPGLEGSGP